MSTTVPAYGYSAQRVADARLILESMGPEDRAYLARILTAPVHYSGAEFDRAQWLAGALTDCDRRQAACR